MYTRRIAVHCLLSVLILTLLSCTAAPSTVPTVVPTATLSPANVFTGLLNGFGEGEMLGEVRQFADNARVEENDEVFVGTKAILDWLKRTYSSRYTKTYDFNTDKDTVRWQEERTVGGGTSLESISIYSAEATVQNNHIVQLIYRLLSLDGQFIQNSTCSAYQAAPPLPGIVVDGKLVGQTRESKDCPPGPFFPKRHLQEDDRKIATLTKPPSSSPYGDTSSSDQDNNLYSFAHAISFEVESNGSPLWITIFPRKIISVAEKVSLQMIGKSPAIALADLVPSEQLPSGTSDLIVGIQERVHRQGGDAECFQTAVLINMGPDALSIRPETIIARIGPEAVVYGRSLPPLLLPKKPIDLMLYAEGTVDQLTSEGIQSIKVIIDPENHINDPNRDNNTLSWRKPICTLVPNK